MPKRHQQRRINRRKRLKNKKPPKATYLKPPAPPALGYVCKNPSGFKVNRDGSISWE